MSTVDLPAPLVGCLFCHAEGTITEFAPHRWFGFGSEFPRLVCNRCKAVALFEPQEDGWRIAYQRFNKRRQYFYAAQLLGQADWLGADQAIELSTKVYIQRQRVQQAQQGDLSWLKPLDVSIPNAPSAGAVYLTFAHVNLHQEGNSDDQPLDTGSFFVTYTTLHLLGRDRDWSYPLNQIEAVDYSGAGWKIHLTTKETKRYFSCEPSLDETDPQLTTAIIKAFMRPSQ